MSKICQNCGTLQGVKEYTAALWDIYDRIRDGRSTYEPLVFTSDWIEENIANDEDHDSMMLAMERDMQDRGLCPTCGLPDLHYVTEDMIMSEEEAKDLHEMWAEMAAERRMGA